MYREASDVEIIDDLDQVASPPPLRRSASKAKSTMSTGVKTQKATRAARADKESSGEFFDLDVSSSSDNEQLHLPVPKTSPRRGRPPKPPGSTMPPRQPEAVEKQKQKSTGRKPGRPRAVVANWRGESEGEWFDLNAISSSSDNGVDNTQNLRKGSTATAGPPRPRKDKTIGARDQLCPDSVVQQQPTANVKPSKIAKRRPHEPATDGVTAGPVSLPPRKGREALSLGVGEVDYFLDDSDSDTPNTFQVLPDPKPRNPDLLANGMSLLSLGSPSLPTGTNRRKKISMETIEISD
jgi:hypothetical protein